MAASVDGPWARGRHNPRSGARTSPATAWRPPPSSATPNRCARGSPSTRPLAVAIDEVRGWPPLLYACYSRWHRIDPGRAAGMADVVRLLLDAGASPNTNNGARQGYRSALKGSVELNNPDVARVLLEAGANPDQGRPIGEAAGLRDHRCLELLLSHGARVVAGTWTVGAAVYADDAYAVSVLLEAMESGNGQAAREATEALPDAAADASPDVVAALLDAGADPRAHDDDRGLSALRRAVRAGKNETVGSAREPRRG